MKTQNKNQERCLVREAEKKCKCQDCIARREIIDKCLKVWVQSEIHKVIMEGLKK